MCLNYNLAFHTAFIRSQDLSKVRLFHISFCSRFLNWGLNPNTLRAKTGQLHLLTFYEFECVLSLTRFEQFIVKHLCHTLGPSCLNITDYVLHQCRIYNGMVTLSFTVFVPKLCPVWQLCEFTECLIF